MRIWSATRLMGVVCLLAVVPLTSSQQPAADPSSPTFRARTDLVLVPVIVTDASGRYVRNLKREDFTVREDGREQKLAIFEPMLAAASRAPTRPAPSATEFTNAFAEQDKPGHLIILVLDTISTSQEDQGYARAEMIKFVQAAPPGVPMALVSLRRTDIKLLHQFTTEPKDLASALEKELGAAPIIQQSDVNEIERLRNEVQEAEACAGTKMLSQTFVACGNEDRRYWATKLRNASDNLRAAQSHMAMIRKTAALQTLDGLQELAHAFASIPGRKSLVWATAAFPFTAGAAESAVGREWFSNQGLLDLYPWYQRTWQVLNDANTVLYPVDARGLVNPQYDSPRAPRMPTPEAVQRASLRHDDRLATMQIFAQMTGGLAFYNRNDLDAAFAGAVEDTASYYLLGYYLTRKDAKPGWRKLHVEVKAPSLRVRTRSGFFVDDRSLAPEVMRNADFELALRSPLDYTGLKLAVAVRDMQDQGAAKRVTFRIKLDDAGVLDTASDNHFLLQYVATATNQQGKPAAQFSNIFEGRLTPENARLLASKGMYYDVPLDLPPGQYRLRFVVRDNLRGVMGTVSSPFSVPDADAVTVAPAAAPQPSLATVDPPTSLPLSPADLPTPPQPLPPPPPRVEALPPPPSSLAPPATPKSEISAERWGPPGMDEAVPDMTPGVTCPQGQVLHEVGQRLNELVNNISQFDAVEEVVHEDQDKAGKVRFRHRSKFAYLATITRPRPGVLRIEEDRQGLFGAPGGGFPGGIATLGLPSLAFAFHPSMRGNFEMSCDGLGQWQGKPAWILRFHQRENSPSYLQSYNIGGQAHLVPLKGRAWAAADNFQIVHMEAELVHPLPKIQLLSEHEIVDYGMVTFKQGEEALWLPKKAELYFHFRGHRYYRRHLFDNFRLFSVDVNQKVKAPKDWH